MPTSISPPLAQNVAITMVGIFSGILGLVVLIQITLSDGGDLDESDGAKSILMSYIQLIFLLKTFPIAWPDLFITIFRIGGAITALGQHLVNLKCLSKGMTEADVFFDLKIISAAGPPELTVYLLHD